MRTRQEFQISDRPCFSPGQLVKLRDRWSGGISYWPKGLNNTEAWRFGEIGLILERPDVSVEGRIYKVLINNVIADFHEDYLWPVDGSY